MEVFVDPEKLRQRGRGEIAGVRTPQGGAESDSGEESESNQLLGSEKQDEEASFFEIADEEEEEDFVVEFEKRRPAVCVFGFLAFLCTFAAALWLAEDVQQKRLMREALTASLLKAPFQLPRFSAEEWEKQQQELPQPPGLTIDAWTGGPSLLEPGGVTSWDCVCNWLLRVVGYITSTGMVANLLVVEKITLSFKRGGVAANSAQSTQQVVARVWDRQERESKEFDLQEMSKSPNAYGYSIVPLIEQLQGENQFSPTTTQLRVSILLRDNSDNAAYAIVTVRQGPTAVFEVSYDLFITVLSSFIVCVLLLTFCLAISVVYLLLELHVYRLARRKLLRDYLAGRRSRAAAAARRGTAPAGEEEDPGGVLVVDIIRFYLRQRYMCLLTSLTAFIVALLLLLRLVLAKAVVSRSSPSLLTLRILDAMEDVARVLGVALTCLFLLRLLAFLAAASSSFSVLRSSLKAAAQEFMGVHLVVVLALTGTATANHLILGGRIACFHSFGQSLFHTVSLAFGSPLLLKLPPVAAAINILFIICWWTVLLPMLVVVLLFAVKRTVEKSRRLSAGDYPLGAEIPEQLKSCLAEYCFCCTPSLSSLAAFNELRRMRHLQPLQVAPADVAAAGGSAATPGKAGAPADAAAADKANESSLSYKAVAAAAAAARAAAAATQEVRGGERATPAAEGEASPAALTATRVQLALLLATATCFSASICRLVDSPRLSRDAAAAGSRALLSQEFLSTDPLSTTATLRTVPPLWLAAKPAQCALPTPAILLPLPQEPLPRLVTLQQVTSLQGIYDWLERVLADKILNAAYATPFNSPHAPLANPGALLELRRVQLTCRDQAAQSMQALSPVSRSGSHSSIFSTFSTEAFGVGTPPPFTADATEKVYRVGLFFTPNAQLRATTAPEAEVAAQQQVLRPLLGSGEVAEELLLTAEQFAALLNGFDSVRTQATQLREKAFLDYQMSGLDVSWMSYNGDSDVYLLNKIHFELANTGGLRVRPDVEAVPGWTLSSTPSPALPFALLLLCCVLFFFYLAVSFATSVSQHLRLPDVQFSSASAFFVSLDVPLLLALAFFCFFYSVLFTSTLNPGWLLDTNSSSYSNSNSNDTEGSARFRRLASATTHAATPAPVAATRTAPAGSGAGVAGLAHLSAHHTMTSRDRAPAAAPRFSAAPAAISRTSPPSSPAGILPAAASAARAAVSPFTAAAPPVASAAAVPSAATPSPSTPATAPLAPSAAAAAAGSAGGFSAAAGSPPLSPGISSLATASTSSSPSAAAAREGSGSRRLAAAGGSGEAGDPLTLPSIVPGPVQPWPWVPGSSGAAKANSPPPTAESLHRFLRVKEEIENKATRLWHAKLAAVIFLLLLALRALTLTAAVPRRMQHARKLIELLYDARLQVFLVAFLVITAFFAFSFAGFVLLGNEEERFSSPAKALLSCLFISTSKWNFNVAAFPSSSYPSSSRAAAGSEQQQWGARWQQQEERKLMWWGTEAFLLLLCLVFFCCLNYLLLAFLYLRYAQLKRTFFLEGEQEKIQKFCAHRTRMVLTVNNLVILYWKAFIKALQLSIRAAQEAGPAASVQQQAALLRDEFFQEFRNLPLFAGIPTTAQDRVERCLLATLLVRIQQYISDMVLLKAKQHLILVDLNNLGEYQKQLDRLNKKKYAYIASIERALADVNEEVDRLEATLALLSYAEESTVPEDSLLLLQRHRQQQLLQLREKQRRAAGIAALEDVGIYVPPEEERRAADVAAADAAAVAAAAAREERIREWREKVEKGVLAPPSPLHKVAEEALLQQHEDEQPQEKDVTRSAAAAVHVGLLVDDVSVPPQPEQVWLLQQQARASATSRAAAAAAALRGTRGTAAGLTAATAAAATAAAATARAPGDATALPPLLRRRTAAADMLLVPRVSTVESLDIDEGAAATTAGKGLAAAAGAETRRRRSSSASGAAGREDWDELRRLYGGERQPTLHFYEGKGKEAVVRSGAASGTAAAGKRRRGRRSVATDRVAKSSPEPGAEYEVVRITVPPSPAAAATAAATATAAAAEERAKRHLASRRSSIREEEEVEERKPQQEQKQQWRESRGSVVGSEAGEQSRETGVPPEKGGKRKEARAADAARRKRAAGGPEEAKSNERRRREAKGAGELPPSAGGVSEKDEKKKKPPKQSADAEAAADSSYAVLSSAAMKKKRKERKQKEAAKAAGGAFGISILGENA